MCKIFFPVNSESGIRAVLNYYKLKGGNLM